MRAVRHDDQPHGATSGALIERAHRILQDKELLSRKSAKTKESLAEVQFFMWRLDKAMRHLEYRVKQAAPTDQLVMVEP